MPDLRSAINERVVVLDGGLSTTIEAAGHDISGKLWSAQLLADDEQAILSAHQRFFTAGADVATTATYQATFEGFANEGISRERAASLMRRAVAIAREAASAEDRPTWVAASIGPYGAMLADGSEYTGNYGLTVRQLADFHRPRFELLATTGADVLALETIPSATEVEAELSLLAGTGHQAWLSLTVKEGRTRAGEPLKEVFAMAADVPEVIAVGVNCATPHDATQAVSVAAKTGLPVIVYPNSGEGWDARRREWTGSRSHALFAVEEWIADGARLVGGCCRVLPEDIAAIRRRVDG